MVADRVSAGEDMVLVKAKMSQAKTHKKEAQEANHETLRLWGEVSKVHALSPNTLW